MQGPRAVPVESGLGVVKLLTYGADLTYNTSWSICGTKGY